MKKVHQCQRCDTWIDSKRFSGIVHLRCPECKTRYQMRQASVKKHSLIPLLCCVLAIYISYNMIPSHLVVAKLLIIIGIVSIGTFLSNTYLIQAHVYEYEIVESEVNHEK